MKFLLFPWSLGVFFALSGALQAQESSVLPNTFLQRDTGSADQEDSNNPGWTKKIFSPYSFSLGSNFDFVDEGVGIKDLYFNLNSFSPKLFTVKKAAIGLHLGVRKGLSRAYDNFFAQVSHRAYKEIAPGSDSVYLYDYTLAQHTNLSLTNTNFYFSPTVQLLCRPGFRLYLAADVELMKQRLDWSYAYDTLNTFQTSISKQQAQNMAFNYLTKTYTNDQYIVYGGASLDFFIENEDAMLAGKIGGGMSKIRLGNGNIFQTGYGEFSIELLEKKFGLNLRSELRYFGIKHPLFISFNIAKYFNLYNLIEFLP